MGDHHPVVVMVLLWSGWCMVHSLLIAHAVLARARRLMGRHFALYRLLFVMVSLLTLLPVLWFSLTLPQEELFVWAGPWRIFQAVLSAYAILMFWLGARVYDTGFFLGIRQWRRYRAGLAMPPMAFKASGVLRYVRHPWYSGGIALVWAVDPITDVGLAAKLVLTIYLLVGTILEDRKLVRELGDPYREYQKRVPALIPWKGRCPGS